MRREEALLPGRHIIAPTLYAASGLQTNATPQKNTQKKKQNKTKTKKNPLVLELATDSRICR
jgi:hypothetical protein